MSNPIPTSSRWNFPPDVFWLSPLGAAIEVIGHLTAIRERPERFGLHAAPCTKGEVDRTFRDVWAAGWVRGRSSDGTFSFHLDRPRPGPLDRARRLVGPFLYTARQVEVDFADPFRSGTFTAEEFAARKYARFWRCL